ncbi:hypothetical protein A2130_00985 [Candidatus Woesebacteria bacterium GWC2_33_12]|uniref:GatB/Yqey n=1 Tax=Candidatus Woesebacteria bacterium GW2011_GWB1_33_22 TaxID=1618566 RepID=A0A0G0CPK0_9BACT|nr:MAG: hypothetical protein UR29_C0002G0087 [Candidatus Woesebacteria bacterium GW2011_GWC2_33_12]KKP42559.1 MAG: hypothetical protein UR33_C0002G0135 [Candidatus Woesebacteria bacterium GW2011_GWA2_33_20]KKP45302.1 MAG: hypothetical protein UR35_C0002G0135 [Candidatus Woesebacteria bacterium GW2011_GWB1_33_22]KKP47130.1 MAG: hypothetical protein UR37_C0002G0042 [Microgenomates group bacterium GW2011_GWC1_33_28]KKP50972.1 MAG: hypothetical protein UR41_C0002G0136 [Candidatus Woesebacteria bact
MISQKITKLIGEAMKVHDSVRLSTLRMLSSEFNYEKIKLQKELTETDEQNVIRKEARKRKDAIEALWQAQGKHDGIEERITLEQEELNILQEFLPPELSDEEVNQLISDSISQLNAKTIQDLGRVIAEVKLKSPGVDGSKVAEIVRSKLS